MNSGMQWLGKRLALFLSRRRHLHGAARESSAALLLDILRVGDVLLIEGNSRSSTAIKFLTQSTWSHAALYVGDRAALHTGQTTGPLLIEADMVEGVRAVGIGEYAGMQTRICRPAGLNEAECAQVADYAVARLGHQYDLRNIFDLARYLLATPPVPTRAICSTLIAQAFQAIHYPILPQVMRRSAERADCPGCIEEIYHIRHHSLLTPHFDLSPYFRIIKPEMELPFDYRSLHWER